MKIFIICFLVFGSIFCDCIYKGSISKIVRNDTDNTYTQEVINLGEPLISVDFTSCNKKSKIIQLKGKVNSQNTLIGNTKYIDTEIDILRCDKSGNVQEVILTTEKDGLFEFETVRDKKGFLVFKIKTSNEGVRYDIKSFK